MRGVESEETDGGPEGTSRKAFAAFFYPAAVTRFFWRFGRLSLFVRSDYVTLFPYYKPSAGFYFTPDKQRAALHGDFVKPFFVVVVPFV